MALLRRYRVVDADNKGIDKLAIQVDSVGDYYAEATVPVDVTGTPLGTAGNPLVTTGAGVGGGAAATATAAPPTYVEGASVPLSVDLNGTLRTTAGTGGGGGGAATIADGADVAQGATADLAYTTGSGTVVALLKGIFGKVAGTLGVNVQNTSIPVTQSGTWSQDVTDRAARLLGHTTVDNFPATQPVSGTVTATGPLTDTQLRAAAVPVSGPLTDTQLRASAVPVSGTFWQATQPVSVGNFPATQPVSAASLPLPTGAATEASLGTDGATPPTIPGTGIRGWLRSIYDKLSGTLTTDVADRAARLLGHVTVDNASIPVTGTFWQATQPVSGTVTANIGTTDGLALDATVSGVAKDGTDATGVTMPTGGVGIRGWLSSIFNKLNTSIAVTGTFWQATQPVSGTVTANQGANNATPWNESVYAGNGSGVITQVGFGAGQINMPVMLNNVAVSAASTAPVAASQSLVVALSPNVAAAGNVKDLKDANRTPVVLNASSVASVTTEALVTIQKIVGGTVTTGVTEYVVTTGKTLRVQLIRRGCRFTTMSTTVTFANTTIKLRQSTTTLSSSSALVIADNLSAASNLPTPDTDTVIPDGLEFPSATHIGFSHVGSATTLSEDVTLIGFEY